MRMIARTGALLLLLTSGSAWAAEMVIGGGRARACYLDAERDRASERAIDGCTKAIETEHLSGDDLVATHVNRGILHLQMKQSERALRDFDRAIAIDRDEPEAYLNKAAALFRSEDRWRESIALFTIAIEKNTRRPEIAYFGRGLVHEFAGDVRAAYADLKKANELAPGWDQPVQELARYSVKRGG